MYTFKDSLTKLTGNTSRFVKKTTLSAVVISALSLGIGVQGFADSNLTTVYYVYLNNEYIGTVSSKAVVEGFLEDKLSDVKDSLNKNYDLTIGTQLTYVPEQVFRTVSHTDDKRVIEKLNNQVAVEAESAALIIDDKPVVHLKDKKDAEQVIKALKLKYVSKEELKKLEAQKKEDSSVTLPPLKENESRLLDVRLSKEVSISSEKVLPKDILTVEQAVTYLTKGTLEEKKYAVKDGDVLGQIANDHSMTLKQMLSINPGITENTVLKLGQELNITYLKPVVEVVVEKEVFKKEVIPFQKEVVEDSSIYKGNTKVKQEGKNGLKEATYKVTAQNGTVAKQETVSEKILQKPVNKIVIKGTKVIPSRGDGSFAWPTSGGYVSSQMGYRWSRLHKGIDIARPSNRTIKAADNGIVVSAGWDSGGYGNKIIIDHQNGYRTVYAHLASISVSVGQTVQEGSKIGVMGSTGDSTGVHLHFEVYKNGRLENPLSHL